MNKWLIPKFLKRLDTFLLENQPTIWRTRIHFVLFYAILAIPIFFVVGYFYPIPHTAPIVDPIKPIEITREIYYFVSSILCLVGVLYWAYLQYQFPLQSDVLEKTALTLLMYAMGLYVIIAFTAPAFRMGTIVQTAYNWMDEKDIEYLKKNNFFLYGFANLEEDTLSWAQSDTFFQKRENIFKDIWKKEDAILQNRYVQSFWYAFSSHLVREGLLSKSYNSHQLDWFYLSYESYTAYLSEGMGFMGSRKDKYELIQIQSDENSNEIFSISELRTLSQKRYVPNLIILLDSTNIIGKSYILYKVYRSYQTDFHPNSLPYAYLSDMSDYSAYYQKNILPLLDSSLLNRSSLQPLFDTIYIQNFIPSAYEALDSIELVKYRLDTTKWIPNRLILIPKHIYNLEDNVRSVQHARLYLKTGIFRRVLWTFLLFLPSLCLLLSASPYVSFRMILWALAASSATAWISSEVLKKIILDENILNGYTYLALPVISILLLILGMFLRNRNNLMLFAFHLLIINVAAISFFSIFGGEGFFTNENYTPMDKPVNLAFFGAPVIGLIGLLLMAYLQAQPKSS